MSGPVMNVFLSQLVLYYFKVFLLFIRYITAARRRQLNLKSYLTIQCNRMLKYNIITALFCGDSLRWPGVTHYSQKLSLTSLISDGRSIVIVRSRIKATKYFFCFCFSGIPKNFCLFATWLHLQTDCDSSFTTISDFYRNGVVLSLPRS
jgi:hypothetical protein